MTPTTRDRFVTHSHEAWRALVNFAFLCPPDQREQEIDRLAHRLGAPATGIRRKVEAILASKELGLSQSQIIEAGQSATLSAKHKQRKNGQAPKDPERIVSWRVDAHLAEAIKPDPERHEPVESLQSRCMRVLKIRTSNDFWEFLLSCFADLSDAELRNLAGVFLDKKKRPVV